MATPENKSLKDLIEQLTKEAEEKLGIDIKSVKSEEDWEKIFNYMNTELEKPNTSEDKPENNDIT